MWYGNMSDATMDKLKKFIVSRPGYKGLDINDITDIEFEHTEAYSSEYTDFPEDTYIKFKYPRMVKRGARAGQFNKINDSVYVHDIIELMNFIAEN